MTIWVVADFLHGTGEFVAAYTNEQAAHEHAKMHKFLDVFDVPLRDKFVQSNWS